MWHKNDLALLHSNTAAYRWQDIWNMQKLLSQAFKSNTHVSNANDTWKKKFKKISASQIFHYKTRRSYKRSILSLNMKLALSSCMGYILLFTETSPYPMINPAQAGKKRDTEQSTRHPSAHTLGWVFAYSFYSVSVSHADFTDETGCQYSSLQETHGDYTSVPHLHNVQGI